MDRATWDDELARCYPRVLRALVGVSGSRVEAEDALHGAIEAALRPGVLGRIEHSDAWLFGVGTRILGRARWRRRLEIALEHVGVAPRMDDRVIDRLLLEHLLRGLTQRQRAVIVARYYMDLTHAQIATALRMREGTVSATLHQALQRLRQRAREEPGTWQIES